MHELLKWHDPSAAQAILIYHQMLNLAKIPLGVVQHQQKIQIIKLLHHAYQYSGFWKNRLQLIGFQPGNNHQHFFKCLQPLQRHELQESFEFLRAPWPGLSQQVISTHFSSGSTGTPVRVEKSIYFQKPLDDAYALLDLSWHHRDPNNAIAFIGYQIEDKSLSSWGGIYHQLGFRGRYEMRSIANRDEGAHLDWLQKIKPSYLKASPFLVEQIARVAKEKNTSLALDQVISMSERVSPAQRAFAEEIFGAKIIDRYSCEEVGMMALQCPKHDHLHVLSPSTFLEIVDCDGNECAPGKPGRVLVTNLFSYSMPIIRYDLGDIAEWGEACDCGISWPVLGKLWGRERNQVILADGISFPMPFLGDDLAKIKNIREFCVKQFLGKELKLEIAVSDRLTTLEIDFICSIMRKSGLGGMVFYIEQLQKIEWAFGKKREEFIRINENFKAEPTNLIQLDL